MKQKIDWIPLCGCFGSIKCARYVSYVILSVAATSNSTKGMPDKRRLVVRTVPAFSNKKVVYSNLVDRFRVKLRTYQICL